MSDVLVGASERIRDRGGSLSVDRLPARSPRPFIKWAGGKGRLLSRLLPHFPETMADYFEPFLGGGSVFFAVRARITGQAHLSDLNAELINAWQVIASSPPTALLTALSRYRIADSEDFYYRVREEAPADPVDRAARFIYLNQTSWNGLWRVNRYGEYNVPWGQRSFRGLLQDSVEAVAAVTAAASIQVADFRQVLVRASHGDFVYLDPPYLPVSDTSKFSFYTERRFRLSDLKELASLCDALSRRGVRWVMSNRDTPSIRALFGHHKLLRTTTRRSVAAQNTRDVEPVDSPEVIIIGT
jgi:DNA adenine methylase